MTPRPREVETEQTSQLVLRDASGGTLSHGERRWGCIGMSYLISHVEAPERAQDNDTASECFSGITSVKTIHANTH